MRQGVMLVEGMNPKKHREAQARMRTIQKSGQHILLTHGDPILGVTERDAGFGISDVDSSDKWSSYFAVCTGATISGFDSKIGKRVSVLLHQLPMQQRKGKYAASLDDRLTKIVTRCEPGSIRVGVWGGHLDYITWALNPPGTETSYAPDKQNHTIESVVDLGVFLRGAIHRRTGKMPKTVVISMPNVEAIENIANNGFMSMAYSTDDDVYVGMRRKNQHVFEMRPMPLSRYITAVRALHGDDERLRRVQKSWPEMIGRRQAEATREVLKQVKKQ